MLFYRLLFFLLCGLYNFLHVFAIEDKRLNKKIETHELFKTKYKLAKVLPYVEHGWFFPESKKNLELFIKRLKPKVIVELGSWLGLSTFDMAAQLEPESKLYAVDTWKGGPDHVNHPEFKKFLPTLYEQFLSNCIHKNLTHIIIPIRMKTLEAAKLLDVKPELVFVDASHEEQDVYNDIIAWYPKLKEGGIMCGDDYFWPTVVRAVKKAAKLLNQKIGFERNFWYFAPKITRAKT